MLGCCVIAFLLFLTVESVGSKRKQGEREESDMQQRSQDYGAFILTQSLLVN